MPLRPGSIWSTALKPCPHTPPPPAEDEELWDCCLTLDPAPQMEGGGQITLRLSWRALEGMVGPPRLPQAVATTGGVDDGDGGIVDVSGGGDGVQGGA